MQLIQKTLRDHVGMHRTVILLCLLLTTAVCHASKDDFIRQAVSLGVNANGCYLIENIEYKKISQKKLCKMLKSKTM